MTDRPGPETVEALDPVDDAELVPEDDTVIGRAFRWSLVFLVLAAVVTGVVAVVLTRPDPVEPPAPAPTIQVVVPMSDVDPPTVVFTEITAWTSASAPSKSPRCSRMEATWVRAST